MRYLEYKEHRTHGTADFPFGFYAINPGHPRYHMVYHWHSEYEIIRVLDGSLELTMDGRKFKGNSGDAFIVSEGMLHGGIPRECTYECIVFDLNAALEGVLFCKQDISPLIHDNMKIKRYYSAEDESVLVWVNRLFESAARQEKGYALFVLSNLYGLLGEIIRRDCWEERKDVQSAQEKRLILFKDVLRLIRVNYSENLSLKDMAQKAGMNEKYFCRYFREMTQKSPMEYLNYYRIECACEQIAVTGKSMTEIALDCGFNDLSYFIRVFKKYKNMTPVQYSKSVLY